jgi:hypothetical protein
LYFGFAVDSQHVHRAVSHQHAVRFGFYAETQRTTASIIVCSSLCVVVVFHFCAHFWLLFVVVQTDSNSSLAQHSVERVRVLLHQRRRRQQFATFPDSTTADYNCPTAAE